MRVCDSSKSNSILRMHVSNHSPEKQRPFGTCFLNARRNAVCSGIVTMMTFSVISPLVPTTTREGMQSSAMREVALAK